MQSNPNSVHTEILKHLSISGFNTMQEAVIARAAQGDNFSLLSPTGSGKTLGFLIAILNRLSTDDKGVQALIVAPSRELALQIETVFRSMKTPFKISCCYGGHSVRIEQNSLSETPAVIIGTPGRLADHINRKSFDLSTVKMVVLDEFDKSLQLGFHEQLEIIFKALGGKQQHLLTSATGIEDLPRFLPFRKIEILNFLSNETVSKLQLKLVRTPSKEKPETLMRLVAGFNREICLVFCNHIEAVNRLSALLKSHRFEHGIYHGDLEQADREKNLIKFRSGATNVLIATDLASRGLDIPEIRHIVHYQLPHQQEAFLHRNGRTARMYADGKAYLLIAEDENLREYVPADIEEITVTPLLKLPPAPEFACLYISAGKKEKINKGDILGFLTQKGKILASDIGLIATLDHSSFVAVKRSLISKLLTTVKEEKIKKMKVKIEFA